MNKIFLVFLILLFSSASFAAMNCAGTDDYAYKTQLTGYSSSATTGTLSIWVKPASWGQQGILIRNRNGSGVQMFFETSGGNKIVFHWGTQNTLSYTATLTAGTWYHIAAVADGSTHRIYLDGTQVASTSSSSTAGTFTGNFQICGISAGGYHLNAIISEPAFWQGDYLRADEVLQLSKSRGKRMPLQIRASSLLFYAPLDEKSNGTSLDGVTLKDLSNQGNDITGVDGANNTGMTAAAEEVNSYP